MTRLALVGLAFVTACAPAPARSSVFVPLVNGSERLRGVSVPRPLWNCDDLRELHIAWYYDWSTHPARCDDREAIPMIWGDYPLPTELGGNSRRLLVLNEPDNCSAGAACISPQRAAEIYRAVESRWPDRLLTGPAVFNDLTWLTAWHAEYVARYGVPPRMDELGVHCYWESLERCIQWVEEHRRLADAWGVRGLRVTEFILPTPEEVSLFVDYLGAHGIPNAYFAIRLQEDGGVPHQWVRPLLDEGGRTAWGEAYR